MSRPAGAPARLNDERGTTIFLTGDTHLTGVYESDDGFEARPERSGRLVYLVSMNLYLFT